MAYTSFDVFMSTSQRLSKQPGSGRDLASHAAKNATFWCIFWIIPDIAARFQCPLYVKQRIAAMRRKTYSSSRNELIRNATRQLI